MNVETEAEATLFPEKEYINGIFVAVQSCKVPRFPLIEVLEYTRGPRTDLLLQLMDQAAVHVYPMPLAKQ
jgi:hypothetical protein